jgi:hypothetical protein
LTFKIPVLRERVNFPGEGKSSADLMFSIKEEIEIKY